MKIIDAAKEGNCALKEGKCAETGKSELVELLKVNPKDIDYGLLKAKSEDMVTTTVIEDPSDCVELDIMEDILENHDPLDLFVME